MQDFGPRSPPTSGFSGRTWLQQVLFHAGLVANPPFRCSGVARVAAFLAGWAQTISSLRLRCCCWFPCFGRGHKSVSHPLPLTSSLLSPEPLAELFAPSQPNRQRKASSATQATSRGTRKAHLACSFQEIRGFKQSDRSAGLLDCLKRAPRRRTVWPAVPWPHVPHPYCAEISHAHRRSKNLSQPQISLGTSPRTDVSINQAFRRTSRLRFALQRVKFVLVFLH